MGVRRCLRLFCAAALFAAAGAAGETLEQKYLQQLHRGRADDWPRLREHFEFIKASRLACRLQLREKRVPAACYQTLAAEQEWNLRPPPEARRLITEFDRRCRQAAEALNVPLPGPSTRHMSANCRRAVAEARKIQEYRNDSAAPSWPAD